MRIKKLIKILQKLDPELLVVISGYEGGYSDVCRISEIKLNLNVNDNCPVYGEHERDDVDGKTKAVLIN